MTETFIQIHCALDLKTPRNVERAIEIFEDDEGDETSGRRAFRDGFDLCLDGDAATDTRLIMAAEKQGDPDAVTLFVRLCAQEFGLTGRWGFLWARTSSKGHARAAGGGAKALDLATGEVVAAIDMEEWLTLNTGA